VDGGWRRRRQGGGGGGALEEKEARRRGGGEGEEEDKGEGEEEEEEEASLGHGEVVGAEGPGHVEEDTALAAHVLLIIAGSSNTGSAVHWG